MRSHPIGPIQFAAWFCALALACASCEDGAQSESNPTVGDLVTPRPQAPAVAANAPTGKGRRAVTPTSALRTLTGAATTDMGPSRAHVELSFDRVAPFERTEQPAADGLPRRLSFYFDRARITQALAQHDGFAVQNGGLMRVRLFNERNGVRVSFDLADDANPRWTFGASPFRVIVDVTRVALPRVTTTLAPTDPHPLAVLVLDPGHGGDDHGARQRETGLRESQVALALAQRVKEILRTRLPDTRVLLTRDDDTFVSLEQRAALANVVQADAFISIHLNASPVETDKGGVTTFVLDTSSDRQARRLAAIENGISEAEISELETMVASLRRDEQVRHARALADRVHLGTLVAGRRHLPSLHDRGVQSALFYVLVGASMPAVLVEASFILRAPESRLVGDPRYQESLAQGIVEGVVRYARGDAASR